MTTTIKTEHPHIVRVPGVCGGEPVIAGTRMPVWMIARLLSAGEEPSEMIAAYPHIPPAAIYDAVSYYLDHRDEIDRFIEENTLEKLAEKLGFTIEPDGRVIFKKQ